MPSHLQAAYDARLAQGEIRPDAAQAAALAALVRLEGDLARAEPSGFASFFKKPESQKGVYLRAMQGICDLSEGELADLLYFQSSGCLSAVRRCINASPEEWARTQAAIDNFILGGLAASTRRL